MWNEDHICMFLLFLYFLGVGVLWRRYVFAGILPQGTGFGYGLNNTFVMPLSWKYSINGAQNINASVLSRTWKTWNLTVSAQNVSSFENSKGYRKTKTCQTIHYVQLRRALYSLQIRAAMGLRSILMILEICFLFSVAGEFPFLIGPLLYIDNIFCQYSSRATSRIKLTGHLQWRSALLSVQLSIVPAFEQTIVKFSHVIQPSRPTGQDFKWALCLIINRRCVYSTLS